MKNVTRALVIVGVVCSIIIIFCLGKYFHKYYIIAKFQQKIDEIEESGNYIFKEDRMTYYIKDDIHVQEFPNDVYIINDKNTNQSVLIREDGTVENTAGVFYTVSSVFSIKDTIEEATLWNIRDNLIYTDLTSETINGKKCYKLFYISESRSDGITLYFDKETYMPVAYEYENGQMNYVEITVGAVTDEDVSMEAIIEKQEK